MANRFLSLTLATLAFAAANACGQSQEPGSIQPAATPQAQTTGTSAPSDQQSAPSPEAAHKEDGKARLPTDANEIVRRAIAADHKTIELARNYTCQQREVTKELDKHGNVKSTEVKTYDLSFYYGEEYSRLIMKDDKPLSEKEQKKEDEKLEKFLAKYRNETPEERQRRQDKEKKKREENRDFIPDIINAYDFKMMGEEELEGVKTWVIEATPRKDFKPTMPHADILKKVKGKLWIDQNEYNWVRVEAEAIDTISFGLFLFRIHPGSHFNFQQLHLNNEVWLVRRFYINGGARIALLKNEAIEQEDVFSNYKKFSSSVTILPGVREVPPEEKSQPPNK
ncbi:MAG TPA: hypothetical protein VFT65_20010 [Candidatus Angelobacter sp.]|nr:hypothetical protein [Candidatus Angelobacter sp.]